MDSIRQKQVAEVVKRHFSVVLQREGAYLYGKEPLVTVTNVRMSSDLSIAKIYLSIYNTEHKQEVLLHLEDEIGHLRQALARRIKLEVRRIPALHFFLDDTVDEMYRVEELFNRLEHDGQMGSTPGEKS
jgi:ribosome-binding factor A